MASPSSSSYPPSTAPHSSSAGPPSTTITQPQPHLRSEFGTLTLEHTLEDLSARFIVNLPAEELESMDRVCFQIEQAHWYYEDFVRPAALNPSLLPSFSLKQFLLLMFKACPLLNELIPKHQQIWTSFMAYKERVPVCGAILISEFWDKVLLVKGWQKGASWSFPRGKINKEEAEGMCAVREVLEETGFDLSAFFPRDQLIYGKVDEENAERNPYYVELVIKEQKIRLYFIPGIHEDTYFETRTRKEISKIDWFNLSDLPTWSKDRKGKKTPTTGQKQAKFYMVTPFISHLKLWIDRNKPRNLRKRQSNVNNAAHARPMAPTPFTSATHDALSVGLPLHLQQSSDDAEETLADSDLDAEPSSSSPSPSSEEDGVDEGVRRHSEFASTEAGTMALKAFFFGGEPESQLASHLSLPSGPPTNGSPGMDPLQELVMDSESPAQTPPQLAYKRQTSFVQPRPKATPQQTSKLLALLTNNNPVASPPPQKPSRRRSSQHQSGGAPAAPAIGGPQDGGDLLSSLDQILNSNQSTIDLTMLRPPSAALSDASTSPAQSILFANSAPPPEAAGFGETHVPTEAERSESERNEKREALMRALYSVVTLPPAPAKHSTPPPTPPSAVPSNIASLFKGPPRRDESPAPPLNLDFTSAIDWNSPASPTINSAFDDLRRAIGLPPLGAGSGVAGNPFEAPELNPPPAPALPPIDFASAPDRRKSSSHSSGSSARRRTAAAKQTQPDSSALLALLRGGGRAIAQGERDGERRPGSGGSPHHAAAAAVNFAQQQPSPKVYAQTLLPPPLPQPSQQQQPYPTMAYNIQPPHQPFMNVAQPQPLNNFGYVPSSQPFPQMIPNQPQSQQPQQIVYSQPIYSQPQQPQQYSQPSQYPTSYGPLPLPQQQPIHFAASQPNYNFQAGPGQAPPVPPPRPDQFMGQPQYQPQQSRPNPPPLPLPLPQFMNGGGVAGNSFGNPNNGFIGLMTSPPLPRDSKQTVALLGLLNSKAIDA